MKYYRDRDELKVVPGEETKLTYLEKTLQKYHGQKETKKVDGKTVADPKGIEANKIYQEGVFKNLNLPITQEKE